MVGIIIFLLWTVCTIFVFSLMKIAKQADEWAERNYQGFPKQTVEESAI
ncbi:hypothetical protein H5P36_19070 [Bacillus sp. APMAM]|nr:hypothetical protein [Bacillus sp. APMAM]